MLLRDAKLVCVGDKLITKCIAGQVHIFTVTSIEPYVSTYSSSKYGKYFLFKGIESKIHNSELVSVSVKFDHKQIDMKIS